MKKLIPVLLSLFMVLALTGGTALAETVYTESALNYTIADESITITGYFGKDEEVTIPASIAGIPVNTVAKGAFADSSYVKTVNLPDTITTVEEGAFAAGITVNYNSNIGGGSKPGGDKLDNDKSGEENPAGSNPTANDPAGSKADDNNSGVTGGSAGGNGTGTTAGAAGSVTGNAGTAGSNGGTKNSGIDEGEVFVDETAESENGQNGASDQTETSGEAAASDQTVAAQQGASLTWLWVTLGVIAAAAVGVVMVVMRKKKK